MPHSPFNRRLEPGTCFRPALLGVAMVFLTGSFLYVWLRVEPRLEFYRYGPFFHANPAWIEPNFKYPGGLTNLAGVLLAQLNYASWLGALVFVLSQGLLWLAGTAWLARLSGRAPGFIMLAPLFLLLFLRNHYGGPVPALSLGLLLALAVAAVHAWVPWRRAGSAAAAGGLMAGALFFVAGFWPAFFAAVLCSLFVALRLLHWRAGLGGLILALAAPAVTLLGGDFKLAELLHPGLRTAEAILAALLYASVPVAGTFLAWRPTPAAPLPEADPDRAWQLTRRGQTAAGLLFLVGWAVVWLTFDRQQKLLAELDCYVGSGQYEAALAAAGQVKTLNEPARIRTQLALYHTGRLAEELFSFHSLIDSAPSEGLGEDCRAQSLALLELGLVHDAEHMAYEALVMEGDRPDLLRLLARVYLLKDQPQAAQVFLNVLSQIPFQGQRANPHWPRLGPQVPAAEATLLSGIRARMLTNDVLHDGLPLGHLLEVLLAACPTNRMAFEYLLANDLLELDLKSAVEHLQWLDRFDYRHIPRAYEEALLLFQQLARVQVDLKGRSIRPETVERFRQFVQAARELKPRADGRARMVEQFGDTYWLYYATRRPHRPDPTP